MGFGTSRDKTAFGHFFATRLVSDSELSSLYYGDPIAATAVDLLPQDAFRRGYCLESDTNQAAADRLQDVVKAMHVNQIVQEAATWGRLFGGALLILGVNDGQAQDQPMREGVKGLTFLNVVDKRTVNVMRYYEDPLAPNYGKPMLYMVTSEAGGVAMIHESRVIRFEGIPVDYRERRKLNGWSYSVLQRAYDRLRAFATAFNAVGALVSDANQAVFKVEGLIDMISVPGGSSDMQNRMQLVDMMRSSLRSVVLDAEHEDFTRVATSFAGLPELLDRLMMLLSSSTGVPVSKLMGRSAAGMNATGEGDQDNWYDTVAAYQVNELDEVLMRIYSLIDDVPEDLEIEWRKLSEPTEKEQADTCLVEAQVKKTEAETYQIYVTIGALLPEQVALAEFSDATDGEIEVDVSALTASLSNEIELSLNPAPDPVPIVPAAPAVSSVPNAPVL